MIRSRKCPTLFLHPQTKQTRRALLGMVSDFLVLAVADLWIVYLVLYSCILHGMHCFLFRFLNVRAGGFVKLPLFIIGVQNDPLSVDVGR